MRYLLILFLVFGLHFTYAQNPKRLKKEVREYKKLDRKKLKQGDILFVGSSSIRFWETLEQDFPNHKVFNRGFGGSQMSDLLFYLKKLVLKYKPKQIFIYEGDNDINDRESPSSNLQETKIIIQKIHEKLPDTEIVLISAKPSISRWELKKEYEKLNKMFEEYTREHSFLKFVDVWNPMLNDQGEPKKDIFIADDLHMNAKGYQIWKEVIRPYLK